MEIVAWILVAVLAVAVAALLLKRSEDPHAGALDRLARDLERGGELPEKAAGDPPELQRIRSALAQGWRPRGEDSEEDPADRAIRGLVRYLRGAAIRPLRTALGRDGQLPAVARDVVDALEDLEFYASEPPEEEPRRENLPDLVHAVVRDYIQETDVPVKLRFSASSLPATVHPEAFKDALFLLLANAGRFGDGKTVEVETEGSDEGIRVRIIDRGPGFSAEALEKAFDPFWTTDSDAVGMGLPYAQRILEGRGMHLRVGNREGGGAEAVIFVPRS